MQLKCQKIRANCMVISQGEAKVSYTKVLYYGRGNCCM